MASPRPVANPPNPFRSAHVEWEGPPPDVRLEVYEEHARSIVSENDSPDVGFRYSVNPYRGCFHGCIYCYARPSHQYLGFGAGTDFDRKIVVKVNAPERLHARLSSPRWSGAPIAFSGNTDCYQPLEASYALTRRCLEVCLAHANPVGVITKGNVIRRDVALLAALERRTGARVSISLAFDDDAMRRRFDPFAAPVHARLDTIRRLADAGVPVGVGVSPILPGVNDAAIPAILERAAEAGATHAFMTLVRLPAEVRPYFEVRLEELLPQRARKVRHGIRELRGGRANDPRFGARMRGQGARWRTIEQLFAMHARRLGLTRTEGSDPPARKRRQLALFDAE
ncbi:MAG TPA: PA0069 family radical SAM protein [Sandaracinaceae bacterium LLY-WYZ-13_1]|nr:PA0069 family radical SAM protein [Sandaracinaceae bacterium LLY-WYZ-13_1]